MANAKPATEKPIFPMRVGKFCKLDIQGVGSVLCSVL